MKQNFPHPFCPQIPGTAKPLYPLRLKILLHLDVLILVTNGRPAGHSKEEEGKKTPKHHAWKFQSATEQDRGLCTVPVRSSVTFRPQRAGLLERPTWGGPGWEAWAQLLVPHTCHMAWVHHGLWGTGASILLSSSLHLFQIWASTCQSALCNAVIHTPAPGSCREPCAGTALSAGSRASRSPQHVLGQGLNRAEPTCQLPLGGGVRPSQRSQAPGQAGVTHPEGQVWVARTRHPSPLLFAFSR